MQEYKFDGEVFLLDDSKGCFVDVYHSVMKDEVIGRVGVALDTGTNVQPYAWNYVHPSTKEWAHGLEVTLAGFRNSSSTSNMDGALAEVCGQYLSALRRMQEREAFNPEAACAALHQYIKTLPDVR